MKGIPPDIDDDAYFDPKVRNMIILDDLMVEAGKDPRITDLYTKGSHHRNLSVVTLMQNFFGPGTKTIRRNAQYIVLFDMPADRLEITTIARQMFPGRQQSFLSVYDKAVSDKYGQLLIINKPNMQPSERLKPNLFKQAAPAGQLPSFTTPKTQRPSFDVIQTHQWYDSKAQSPIQNHHSQSNSPVSYTHLTLPTICSV